MIYDNTFYINKTSLNLFINQSDDSSSIGVIIRVYGLCLDHVNNKFYIIFVNSNTT